MPFRWPFSKPKPDQDHAGALIKSLDTIPREGAKSDGPTWLRVLLLALTGRWPLAVLQIILLILERSVSRFPTPSRIEAYQSINRLRVLTFDHSDSVAASLESK
jgi:hypothetical protein